LALFYLDTSALVKLYVREPGTEALLRLASRQHGHRFTTLSTAEVEFRSAIRRRERAGDLERNLADQLIRRFENHLETRILRQPLNESVLETASALIDTYPLRAYDAVQLAGCLMLRAAAGRDQPVFVCADVDLLETANRLKLSTLNPAER
jgi:predicted nucleic acid-binding protein